MKKIGIDARMTYYRVGGISTYIRRIVSALETLDKDNDYLVFHSRKANFSITKSFKRANLWTPAHHKLERYTLSAELLRHQLDLWHSPDFIPPQWGAKRFVVTVHDLTFLHYPQYLTKEARGYYNAQIGYAVSKADHILTVSHSAKQDLMTMLHVPEAKITVHTEGADEAFTPLSTDTIRQHLIRLNLPKEGYILHVGTLEPRKNIIGLLKAYHQVRQSIPTAPPLVLVGRRGWLFHETETLMNTLQLGKNLILREDISDSDLPYVYNGAMVAVTPSFYEGFGLPTLEAMACGIVPIVSNRSSLPEVVGEVGLQITPENTEHLAGAIYHAITNPAWRTEQGKRALERASQFSWQDGAKTVLEVYQSLL